MSHQKSVGVAVYARATLNIPTVVTQLTAMREFAAQRGWTIVAEFVDAYSDDRPSLRDLLAAAEEHAFDTVLVYTLVTLADSIFDTLATFETLGKHNVGFASVQEPQFDLTTPTDRLPLDLIANLGQYYDNLLHRRANTAKHQRSSMDLYTIVPHYGYQHDGDPQTPPIIVKEEAEAIRLAFERYAAGKDSYQDIADLLNESGYRTRRGRNFSKDTVAGLLRNPFYAGKAMPKDQIVPGQHDAIVSEGLWNTAHHIREQHHHASRTSKDQGFLYLLNRIASCHICGRHLRVQSTATANFYREMPDPHSTCPNSQTGVQAEVLHQQIEAIFKEMRLPQGWQEKLEQTIVEGDAPTLQNRRARLVALRRRLKEGYLRGDFEEDEDIYQRELARVRREIEHIPTEKDHYRVRQVVQRLGDLAGAWDEVDAADLGDMLQLMLRDVQVDVIQGRLLFLRPYAPFIPLFRSHSLLQERDVGNFVPVWSDDLIKLLPYPALPPLTQLPDKDKLANLPFLPNWPWTPSTSIRISPPLSTTLKARRKVGFEGGTAIAVSHPGIPPIILNTQRWSGVSLKTLSSIQALEKLEEPVIFLDTPLAIQHHPIPEELVQTIFHLLAQEGYWHLVDIVPSSMPAHWIFAFFPEAWSYAQSSHWKAYDFYNVLRRVGFQVEQQEHTFYRQVSLEVALKIARQRSSLLSTLPDEIYLKRITQLEQTSKEQGSDTLVASEVTVVEVMAVKETGLKKQRRRKRRG